jgi:hypothetical protein
LPFFVKNTRYPINKIAGSKISRMMKNSFSIIKRHKYK